MQLKEQFSRKRNIIITGASKGMGKEMAKLFAAEGCNVFLGARNEKVLQHTASELIKEYPGSRIFYFASDLSNKAGADAFARAVMNKFDKIDVLVNNAGQFIPGSIQNEEDGTLEKMLAVNLFSAYWITRLLLPQMIQQKMGHIFNICSIASLTAYANGGSYSISKFALMGFSKNLREELKPHNIKVTSVFPGAVFTSSWEDSNVDPSRIMESSDIASMVIAISKLSDQACVEDIIIRPQFGDL